MKDYDRVSLSPPLAKALHNYMISVDCNLSLKEVVTQACMEYLERRRGINVAPTNAQDSGSSTVEKKTKKIHPEDILGFSDFLDD